MTRDEMMRLLTETISASNAQVWTLSQEQLERFAALVAAAEREACAKLCEDGPSKDSTQFTHIPTLVGCAAAIRARGNT